MKSERRSAMKKGIWIAVMIFLGGVWSSSLEAGSLMVNQYESYSSPGDIMVNNTYLDKKGMRVETKGENMDQIFIYRPDKGTFWIIDEKEKTYMEITEKDLQEIKQQAEKAQDIMSEQMKNIPPEQRKMMEEMMKEQMQHAPSERSKVIYTKVASGVKVNKWKCDRYEGKVGSEKIEEVWTTSYKQLGISPGDFKVMEDMSNFFGGFAGEQGSYFQVGSKEAEKESVYSGIPIKMITYKDGKKQDRNELKEVKNQDFPASLFNLPKGFTKQGNPMKSGGGRWQGR